MPPAQIFAAYSLSLTNLIRCARRSTTASCSWSKHHGGERHRWQVDSQLVGDQLGITSSGPHPIGLGGGIDGADVVVAEQLLVGDFQVVHRS